MYIRYSTTSRQVVTEIKNSCQSDGSDSGSSSDDDIEVVTVQRRNHLTDTDLLPDDNKPRFTEPTEQFYEDGIEELHCGSSRPTQHMVKQELLRPSPDTSKRKDTTEEPTEQFWEDGIEELHYGFSRPTQHMVNIGEYRYGSSLPTHHMANRELLGPSPRYLTEYTTDEKEELSNYKASLDAQRMAKIGLFRYGSSIPPQYMANQDPWRHSPENRKRKDTTEEQEVQSHEGNIRKLFCGNTQPTQHTVKREHLGLPPEDSRRKYTTGEQKE